MHVTRTLLALSFSCIPFALTAEQATETHVDAAGANFPVVVAGEGTPVVFIHGAFSDQRVWDFLREDVVDAGYRYVAYTQREFGTAEWPEKPGFARDVHEADLVALLDTWSEPVHLVAWSYSGPVVLQAALDRPDLVKSVAVFEPALSDVLVDRPEYADLMSDWGKGWGPTVETVEAGEPEAAVATGIKFVLGYSDDDYEALPEPRREMFRENAHTLAKMFGAPEPTPMTCDDLAQIDVPILILKGEKSQPYFVAAADETASCLPNVTTDEMSGVGHGGPVESPDAFTERVLEFIAGAEGA